MKFEVGKYYRTVNGSKAYLASLCPFGLSNDFIGWVKTKPPLPLEWNELGQCPANNDFSLYDEWVDPPKPRECWALFYEDSVASAFPLKENAEIFIASRAMSAIASYKIVHMREVIE